jgi:LPXTG-motif cell wall-anchored protein
MTAPQAVGQQLRSRGRRPGAWLRRIGGAAVTMALIVLGLGAGLWLGSPASAAPGSIQVDMGDGNFVSSTSSTLLDIAALAPGGSVTGTMKVRDTSGNDGAHRRDAIKLRALGVALGDSCPLPSKQSCREASRALGDQISFTISSTGAGGTGASTTTLKTLDSRGVVLGLGMVDQDTLTVTVTASLDFEAVGDDVQYGSVAFDLALELTSSGNGSGNGADGGPEDLTGRGGAAGGAGSSGDAIGPGDAVAPGAPQVAGENRELPPGEATDRGSDAGKNILVLGENRSELPNTGVPVAPMLAVGGGVLLVGLGLLYAARRRAA